MPAASSEERVLIIAPIGQDAVAMAAILEAEGIATAICSGPGECLEQMESGAGALLVTEEALEMGRAADLLQALETQPPWSELPLIVLTSGGESRLAQLLELAASAAGSVTLLERPMSAVTLLRSTQVALASRRRQYQVRDLLAGQARQQEQLRQAADRLERQVRLFEGVASTTPDFVYLFDLQGRFLYANRQLLKVWGMKLPEVIGRTCRELGYEQWHHDMHMREIAQVIETKRPIKGEVPFKAPLTGIFGVYEYIFAPVIGPKGEVELIAGTTRDITERKAAEAVLARSNEDLERLVAERTAKLNELVGELEHFSYTITHDMRAPLRSMRGFAELVDQLSTSCPHAEHKTLLRRVITSAERMDLLITDALSYSKAVRQELPLGPIDVSALLRGMLDSYPEFQSANGHIRVQAGIPLVLGNQAGLTQCFSNLLGNALKFAKPGQIPEILIRSEMVPNADAIERHAPDASAYSQPAQRVRIWVEDNGIGIAEAMLPRIFNLFARGSTEQEGTGIGLALVRKVVDRMGGRVGVESKAGQGSRFWLELLPGDRRQPISAPLPSPPVGPAQIL